jgi:CDP-2,3-bis-(O-geranylgeranyl)-sn-glycerol synthase
MQYLVVAQLLVLLALANGSPVVAKRIFGNYCSWPLDGNIKFVDGRPLFGAAKTVRGILVSIFITSACAPLLGLELKIGLLVAATAMAGDLLSSFIKRRLGLPPSSKAGLQVRVSMPNACRFSNELVPGSPWSSAVRPVSCAMRTMMGIL